jgi:ribosomal protein S18 acetylase RimI-like enzyme
MCGGSRQGLLEHHDGELLNTPLNLEVVDLRAVTLADLEDLWHDEARFWRAHLLWDVSDTFATLRRIFNRGGLPGKAAQVHARTVGYTYYGIAGHLGVISGLTVSPEWRGTRVGETLLKATVDEIRDQGVSRIESRFVSRDDAWPIPAFERAGFRTYWRECLRFDLRQARGAVPAPALAVLETWRETHLGEAAHILQQAYAGGVEAEIHEPYRTVDGCYGVLDNILNQGSCGTLVHDASAMARYRGRGIGFVLVTEVAPRQGHLTHIVVIPEGQHRGVGRWLLDHSLRQLAEQRFDTLSLIVSRSNARALGIYRAMGFQSVLAFPVFVWEQ